MNDFDYSVKTLIAFGIFLAGFGLMVALLFWLDKLGVSCYINFSDKPDLFSLLTTLPFVAFYLLILLSATAGYARSVVMAEKLPINKLFEAELAKHTMRSASIKTKVRSGGQIRADDTFIRAFNNLLSSRLPILAVIDADNKVTGVITGNDLAKKFQEEFDKESETSLRERLANVKVADIAVRQPVVASSVENLREVAEKMIKNQFTKLIVVEDLASMKFSGTVDMLDLVGEILITDNNK